MARTGRGPARRGPAEAALLKDTRPTHDDDAHQADRDPRQDHRPVARRDLSGVEQQQRHHRTEDDLRAVIEGVGQREPDKRKAHAEGHRPQAPQQPEDKDRQQPAQADPAVNPAQIDRSTPAACLPTPVAGRAITWRKWT